MKINNKFKTGIIFSVLSVIMASCSSAGNDSLVSDDPGSQAKSNIASLSANEPPTRFKNAERIVAIGDLHGDFNAARAAFRLAGATDASDRWIGGRLVVVQTGDQLDRGDGEREIIDFLERLTIEAKAAGGALQVLNGNHELMNANLDLRYVTKGGFNEFSSVPGLNLNNPALGNLPTFEKPRAASFLPGGPFALLLAKRNTIAIVGDTLFVHGGVLPKYVSYGLEKINSEVRQWLRGEAAAIPASVSAEDSPVWSRHFSDESAPGNCGLLEQSLNAAGVKYMVVGHTVQEKGINSACNGKVWRIDVGMSKAYGGPVQVLEIINNGLTSEKFRVLK
jgi:hypothetical protein